MQSCAVVQAPSGGPKDTTAPTITFYSPNNYTTNFKSDRISLEFNSYINKANFLENLIITPNLRVKTDWSGKELDLIFVDTLLPNTTYSFQLGTEFTNYLGNKPLSAFNLVFSTGSQIDSGMIEGQVISQKRENTALLAYDISKLNLDTLNPSKVYANYFVPIGTNGKFNLFGLKPGLYRLMAIEDKQKDKLFTYNQDGYGSYYKDIQINDNTVRNVEINIGTPIDNLPPRIVSVRQVSSNVVNIEFSEQLDTNSLSNDFIELIEKENKEIYLPIAYKFVNASNIALLLNKKLEIEKEYLIIKSKSFHKIKDLSANTFDTSKLDISFFSIRNAIDTLSNVIKVSIGDSAKDIGLKQQIYIQSEGFITNKSLTTKLRDKSGNDQKHNLIKIDDANYKLNADLKEKTEYTFEINIDTSPNGTKTNKKVKFTTKAENIGTNVKGNIDSIPFCKGLLYLVARNKANQNAYKVNVNSSEFEFLNLSQDEYTFYCFCDENGNSSLDYGYPFPFKFAERKFELEGNLKTKPRWDIENFKLRYNGK